jgi:hypothetical protein
VIEDYADGIAADFRIDEVGRQIGQQANGPVTRVLQSPESAPTSAS